jgi:hypothetical protein
MDPSATRVGLMTRPCVSQPVQPPELTSGLTMTTSGLMLLWAFMCFFKAAHCASSTSTHHHGFMCLLATLRTAAFATNTQLRSCATSTSAQDWRLQRPTCPHPLAVR